MIGGNLPRTALAVALLVPPSARAGDDFYGANLEAMGRAAFANPSDVSSLSINPGAIGLDERYDFEGIFDVGPTGGIEWVLAALDARTGPVGFGFAWRRTVAKPPITLDEMPGWITPGQDVDNKKRTHEFVWALAVPVLDRALSFGAGGTLILKNDDRGGHDTTGNMDVGAAWKIDDRWTLGLVGQNLIPFPDLPELASGLGMGVHFEEEFLLSWAADVDVQFTDHPEFPVSFRLGGELVAAILRPRIGYRFEGHDAVHWITPGLGIENDAGAIDYAVLVPVVEGLHFNELVHSLSLRIRL